MNVETLQTEQGTTIAGPLLITPRALGDDRGWFFESWSQTRFNEAVGQIVEFSHDNHSRSTQGVLRGLHFQVPPNHKPSLSVPVWDLFLM